MEFCPHCMRPAQGVYCDSCGKPMQWTAEPGQICLGTILRGAYQVGAAVSLTDTTITYAAMDLNRGRRVLVREYFPAQCATRTETGWVMPAQTQQFQSGLAAFWNEGSQLSANGTVYEFIEDLGTGYMIMEFSDLPVQNSTPEKQMQPQVETPKKKSKKGKLVLLIVLIAVLVLAMAGAAWWYFGCMGAGTTEDGYVYETADDDKIIITGYEGEGGEITIPDMIDEVQVGYIADRAFEAKDAVTAVRVDGSVEPKTDAFVDCFELKVITLTGEDPISEAWTTCLSSCTTLTCVVLPTQTACDAMARSEVTTAKLCYLGQQLHGEELTGAVDIGGVLYARTATDLQILGLPVWQQEIILPATVEEKPVTWICDGATEGMDSSVVVWLPEETLFDYTILHAANWKFLNNKSQFTLAECWKITCEMVDSSNAVRPQDVPPLEPDAGVVRAAKVLAEEQYVLYGDVRPDGSQWGTALNDANVDWQNGIMKWNRYAENQRDQRNQYLANLTSEYAAPIKGGEYAGKYCSRIGVAQFYVVNEAGEETYYFCSIGLIDEAQ